MTRRKGRRRSSKETWVWVVRRREVDVHQLALAYYLLARQRIDQRRAAEETAKRHAERDQGA